MAYKKCKVFSKIINDSRKIVCIDYDDSEDYYSFIKKNHEKGFIQVIITSQIMIQIIEELVFKRDFSVSNMEFMEEDDSYNKDIKSLIVNNKDIKKYHNFIIRELEFLSEKTSIEIKRISFKKMEGDIPIMFYIQSNGILGVNREGFDYVSSEITKLVGKEIY